MTTSLGGQISATVEVPEDVATADDPVTPSSRGFRVLKEAYQVACEHYGISHDLDKHLLRKLNSDRDHVDLAADLVMLEFLCGDHEEDLLDEDHIFCQLARLGARAVIAEIDFEAAR